MQYILIASRGSSSNAARYAQYLLGRAHRVPVAFATPSLYTLYEQPPRLDGALVIGISQSGESPDVKEVLDEARRQGRPTVAITNDPALAARRSPRRGAAARGGRRAGRRRDEDVRQLARRDRAALRDDDRMPALAELERFPAQLAAQLERSWHATREARRCSRAARSSRAGSTTAPSFEIALKIRELSGLLFEAYSAADLMHGPVAASRRAGPSSRSPRPGRRSASMAEAIGASRSAARD